MKLKSTILVSVLIFALVVPFFTAAPAIAQDNCKDAYEKSGYMGIPIPIDVGPGQIWSSICPQDDLDAYRINVVKGDKIRLYMDAPSNFTLSLWDEKGKKELARANNFLGAGFGSTGEALNELIWKADRTGIVLIGIIGDGRTEYRDYGLTIEWLEVTLTIEGVFDDGDSYPAFSCKKATLEVGKYKRTFKSTDIYYRNNNRCIITFQGVIPSYGGTVTVYYRDGNREKVSTKYVDWNEGRRDLGKINLH